MSNVYNGFVWRPKGKAMVLVAMAENVVASGDDWAPYAVTQALLKRPSIKGQERRAIGALNNVARAQATSYNVTKEKCWPGWKLEIKKVASAPKGAGCIVVR